MQPKHFPATDQLHAAATGMQQPIQPGIPRQQVSSVSQPVTGQMPYPQPQQATGLQTQQRGPMSVAQATEPSKDGFRQSSAPVRQQQVRQPQYPQNNYPQAGMAPPLNSYLQPGRGTEPTHPQQSRPYSQFAPGAAAPPPPSGAQQPPPHIPASNMQQTAHNQLSGQSRPSAQAQVPGQGRPIPADIPTPAQTRNMRPVPVVAPVRPMPQTNGYAAPGSTMGLGAPNMHPRQQQLAQNSPTPATSKLNPDMMPRPCALEPECGTPREFYSRGQLNNGVMSIPPTNSDFISVDDGCARLRYMRLTTNSIAADPAVMSKSGVPFALVLNPFADPVPGESIMPVVDLSTAGGGGPLRCERCNGYANPGFKFMNGGSQFQCNICTHTNATPAEHYSPIAPTSGLRMDIDARHEFRFGSVEYIVGSSDYCVRKPTPASYLFAFDISAPAVASGLGASAVASVKAAIAAGMLRGSEAGARAAILTYDRSIHYYDARGADDGKSVTMHLVPDVDDPFVPLGGDALFLTPDQAVAALDFVVEVHGLASAAAQAQTAQQKSNVVTSSQSALGAVLEAIKQAMTAGGGKAFVIAGSIPSVGPGMLERRGGAISGGEERDMGLLKAAIPNYEVLGCELAEAQISVDLVLAPSSAYVDAATLVRVPRACGGRLYMFSSFDPVRDAACLHRSLCSAIGSIRAFEALLRVRTSVGIETTGEYIGHFGRPQRGEDVSGPVFDATSSLALEMSVTSKLVGADALKGGSGLSNGSLGGGFSNAVGLYDDVCVQAAILYTDPAGKRRIRVHTIFANKTTVLADVFKGADVDATLAFFAKKAATAVLFGGSPLSKAREALTDKMTHALFIYRKHCTSAPLSGQLILPEALKTLPVMILGLTKSNAFRAGPHSAQSSDALTLDDRVAALSFLTWAAPADIVAMSYPRLWALHKLQDKAGLPMPLSANPVVGDASVLNGHDGRSDANAEPCAMPNTVALSSAALDDDGVLLVENGMRLVVWIGGKVDVALANDVVAQIAAGRLVIRGETAASAELLKSVGDRGQRIAAVIRRLITQRSALSQPQVVVRQAPGVGLEARYVSPLLVEDKPIGGGFSYVEFLRNVHKRIMDKLANESAQNEIQTWEMLNHGY